MLVWWLKRQGHRVVFLRDPGSTALGRKLRQVLLHATVPLSPLAEALLFIGGRVQLVEEKIRPALARGLVVICDRFHDATIAYQGFGGELDVPWLNRFGRAAIVGVMPRLTILLDVPPAKGFARLRRAKDRIERKARTFHERVRAGYRKLAARERNRFVVLDASQPPDAIQQRIRHAVMQRLDNGSGWRVLPLRHPSRPRAAARFRRRSLRAAGGLGSASPAKMDHYQRLTH